MIDENKDENKTERGLDGLQSLRAYLRANLQANRPRCLVTAIASLTPITMLPSLQAWTEAYPGSATPLNVPIFYKSMPDLAKARSGHSSLDER